MSGNPEPTKAEARVKAAEREVLAACEHSARVHQDAADRIIEARRNLADAHADAEKS